MSRTHLPPLMECPLYTALGRGRENVIIRLLNILLLLFFFNRMC